MKLNKCRICGAETEEVMFAGPTGYFYDVCRDHADGPIEQIEKSNTENKKE